MLPIFLSVDKLLKIQLFKLTQAISLLVQAIRRQKVIVASRFRGKIKDEDFGRQTLYNIKLKKNCN